MRRYITAAIVLTLISLGFRLYLALHLPNDDGDDGGRYYSLLARNLLDHRGYSGLIGAWAMWTMKSSQRWALLLSLLILPRLVFLASQEHSEARYTVEFFRADSSGWGVALARFRLRRTLDPRRGDQDGAAPLAGNV